MCDAANCTLREAIAAANGNGESDTITFDLDDGNREIPLSGEQLEIANDADDPDLTINGDVDGDGTPDITVDAQGGSRVFLIASGADATLQGLVITGGNAFSSDGFNGGGILNDGGMLTVTSSAIDSNSAQFGGGILNDGLLTVTSSTISGNNNSSSLFGAGIRQEPGGTLVSNGAIITGNSPGDCFFGTITSLGFNLEGGTSCGFTAPGDQQNVAVADVLVTDVSGPLLADNGGPTQTIALLDADDNPALDAIPFADCDVDTDQRGVSRPQPADGNCDIGAYELVQDASVTIAGVIELFDDAVADGTLMGAGPGKSPPNRLNALRNMLLTAGDRLEQGEVDAACRQLQDVADRTDGAFPPPDFAQGPAAPDLLDAITELQDELGCFA